jgi:hypothetical protein
MEIIETQTETELVCDYCNHIQKCYPFQFDINDPTITNICMECIQEEISLDRRLFKYIAYGEHENLYQCDYCEYIFDNDYIQSHNVNGYETCCNQCFENGDYNENNNENNNDTEDIDDNQDNNDEIDFNEDVYEYDDYSDDENKSYHNNRQSVHNTYIQKSIRQSIENLMNH